MNKKQIAFKVDRRKFTIRLVPDVKPQNKVQYYTISESENIIDLTIIEDDTTETLKGDDKSHPIIIELEKESISSDENISLIPN